MIHQWEILHSPCVTDPDRYRLSLWSDGSDVEKVRSLFSHRAGVVWIPRRKPYNCSFFLYRLTGEEKIDLEKLLSGEVHFPEKVPQGEKVQSSPSLDFTAADSDRSTGFDNVVDDKDAVRTGLGKPLHESGTLNIGYFVPDYLPNASEKVHEILERTLYEKKVSVLFNKTFSLPYSALSLSEIRRLIEHCVEKSVSHVIAVGEPSHMSGLKKMAHGKGVFVRVLPESVIDNHIWLAIIAEILSYE